ncbi:hypothetical protein SMICM17S_01325 [Streptomyces microflavus]
MVFATGYSPADPLGLLGEVADRCLLDDEGRVRVERPTTASPPTPP